jgi:hypothetical protein
MPKNEEIRNVAIVGTGVIGASWAAFYLARGLNVVATDPASIRPSSCRCARLHRADSPNSSLDPFFFRCNIQVLLPHKILRPHGFADIFLHFTATAYGSPLTTAFGAAGLAVTAGLRTSASRSPISNYGVSASPKPYSGENDMTTIQVNEETGVVPTMIQSASLAKIEVHRLRRDISALEGSGGNIAVLTGKDGKLLIDAGAHEHTKKHLSNSTRVDDWNYTFPPAPAEALPTTTFRDEHRHRHNDTGLALKYYGPAHTDSDISVVFEEADVIHVGDTWWNGFYPFIDYSTGGGIDGMIRATKRNLSVVTDKTIIIPGHGPVGNRSGLSEYYDMLVAIRGNVSKFKTQGKSLANDRRETDRDAKWGQFLMTPPIFTKLVYAGV